MLLLPLVSCALALSPRAAQAAEGPQPLFCFGVVADVQYADKDTRGSRRYREALDKLDASVAQFNKHDLAFVVNLGDLIDGNGEHTREELDRVLEVLQRLRAPVRHVIGNHCLSVKRPELMTALGLARGYYAFEIDAWRLVVLDGMAVSTASPDGSPEAAEAAEYLTRNPRLPKYNGALGKAQTAWLKNELEEAKAAGQHVVVLGHHPVLTEAAAASTTLWDAKEVLPVLEASGVVVAYLAGHHHRGGYALHNGIHHVTFPAICDAPAGGNSYAILRVYPDRLVIDGFGTTPSRELPFALR